MNFVTHLLLFLVVEETNLPESIGVMVKNKLAFLWITVYIVGRAKNVSVQDCVEGAMQNSDGTIVQMNT